MVSLLAIAWIIANHDKWWLYGVVGVVGILLVAWAVWRSKTESKELREMESDLTGTAEKSYETVGSSH
jgi:K(+)-stimulated pyrophosphate-energized sodium pump